MVLSHIKEFPAEDLEQNKNQIRLKQLESGYQTMIIYQDLKKKTKNTERKERTF